MIKILSLVQDAMRSYPVITVLILSLAGFGWAYADQTYAGQSELQRIGDRLDGLECKVELRYLEGEVRRLGSDLYYVGRVVEGDQARDSDHEWFAKVRVELAAKTRELSRVEEACR